MAVVASSYAIDAGVNSFTVARPGAADASGTLYVGAITCISDVSAQCVFGGSWATWHSTSQNRLASYGHYVNVVVYARLGTAAENDTIIVYKPTGSTAAKTVMSATVYRVSDPLSTTTLASNRGSYTNQASAFTTIVYYPGITLIGTGSVLIDVCGMLTQTDAAAASLKLRTGDTAVILHRKVETDTAAYWLSAAHGYRDSQSGTIASQATAATSSLGSNAIAIEVRQSAASGGGPPQPPNAAVGRTLYLGA